MDNLLLNVKEELIISSKMFQVKAKDYEGRLQSVRLSGSNLNQESQKLSFLEMIEMADGQTFKYVHSFEEKTFIMSKKLITYHKAKCYLVLLKEMTTEMKLT